MARESRDSSDETQSSSSEERGGGRRRFTRPPRVCQFCAEKATSIDYKQVDVIRRYVTDQGRIRSRRQTGTCARHQRILARAIKRARHMALVPYAAQRSR